MRIPVKRTCKRNEKGSIEGLPLQLLIMIVIAAVGLGILLAWLQGVDKLKQIGSVIPVDTSEYSKLIKAACVGDPDYNDQEGVWDGATLCIKVYDKENNPLKGAMVTISGCGAYGSVETDNQDGTHAGVADFTVNYRLPIGTQSGDVLLKASKSGYGDGNNKFPVTRGDQEDTYIYNQ